MLLIFSTPLTVSHQWQLKLMSNVCGSIVCKFLHVFRQFQVSRKQAWEGDTKPLSPISVVNYW